MSRVGLIDKTLRRELYTSIQNTNLVGPWTALTNPTADFEFKGVCELLIIEVQIYIGPKGGKVVATNDDTDVARFVVKNQRGEAAPVAKPIDSRADR